MGGLFAALLLRKVGWTVDVFERADVELSGRGAGIVTHAELCSVLEAVGLDSTKNLGVAVQGRKTLDCTGRVIASYPWPQVNTSWDRVFRMLRGAFPADRYHLDKELASVESREESVVAHFADGASVECDLLVGADGFRSIVRGQILPEVQPHYAGYIAWRGLVDETAFSEGARKLLFDCLAFCLPPNQQMLGYPVAGPDNDLRKGRRRYNFVWYRPANDVQLKSLLTDESGRAHPVSIPPTLVRAEAIDTLRAEARTLLAPQLGEAVDLTPQPFLQPIYDVETPQMAFGRIALVGDAAFVGRPHVAAGVTKAAEDAMALATSLQHTCDVPAALQSFESARLPTNRRILQRGRDLGLYLQAELHTEQERRRAAQHHSPQAVMSEIAILDFLHEHGATC